MEALEPVQELERERELGRRFVGSEGTPWVLWSSSADLE